MPLLLAVCWGINLGDQQENQSLALLALVISWMMLCVMELRHLSLIVDFKRKIIVGKMKALVSFAQVEEQSLVLSCEEEEVVMKATFLWMGSLCVMICGMKMMQ